MIAVRKEYRFNNSSEEINALQRDIIELISAYFSEESHSTTVSKARQVLIELFTNGVKHSAAEWSIIKVSIDDSTIQICKSDTGKPFEHNAIKGWPLNPDMVGQGITLHHDDLFLVSAKVESENQLSFNVEEYPIGVLGAHTNLCEHYGFLILVKASNRFTYQYMPDTGVNHFSVIIEV